MDYTGENTIVPVIEQISDHIDELSLDVSDEELIRITNDWIDKGEKSRKTIVEDYNRRKEYYLGTQLKNKRQIVDNRLWLAVETIVPIATSTPPHPNVLPAQDTLESVKLARSWEKILGYLYKCQNIQKKLEKSARFLSMTNFFVMKYYFDSDVFEVKTRVVHPSRLLFDNERNIDDEIPWIAEYITKPASQIIEEFPKKKDEITKLVNNKLGTEITYLEFWTKDMVIYRYNKLILDKKKNPYYNYTSEKKNYFDRPQIPYIVKNLFDLGETITGETSLVEQAIPLQDGVNKRKSQIDKNANIVNGKVIGTGSNGLKESQFASIDWTDSEEGIFMSNGEPTDIQRVMGQPLPQFVENDMIHSINEIDNIMGTHSTTRGEREGRETATGRQLLRESDRGRIDIIGRRFEEALEELFEGWTQLVKVFFKAKQTVRILGKENSSEFLEFDSNSIEDGIEIEIIHGSLIPDDKASRMQRVLSLINAQMISPPDALRELGFRQPEDIAKNLYLWNTNPEQLFAELQQKRAASGEIDTEASLAKANDENKRMLAGEPQPPYERADANHIQAHELFMKRPEFMELKPEIQELFIEHVKGEVAIVEDMLKKTEK